MNSKKSREFKAFAESMAVRAKRPIMAGRLYRALKKSYNNNKRERKDYREIIERILNVSFRQSQENKQTERSQ